MYKVAGIPIILNKSKHWGIIRSLDEASQKIQVTCLLDGTHEGWKSLRVGSVVRVELNDSALEGFKVMKIGDVPVTLEADSSERTEGTPTLDQEIGI